MSLKEKIFGLNKFLSAVYETDMKLSLLLAKIGFKSEEIKILGDCYVEQLVNSSILAIRQRIVAYSDGERLYAVINFRYGLDGEAPKTLENIGKKLGISRERVRQLEQRVLRRYRGRKNRGLIEASLKVVADGLLHKDGDFVNDNVFLDRFDKKWDDGGSVKKSLSHRFSVEENDEGVVYLAISSSQDVPQHRIEIFEEDFAAFYNDFLEIVKELGWEKSLQAYRLGEIRKVYPRAYEEWSLDEEKTLQRLFVEGKSVTEIAKYLGRQEGAIQSRLSKLGLAT